MLFNSAVFMLAFLPTVVAVYYLLGRTNNQRLPVVWLVVSSLFFYGWWDASLVLLLVTSIVVNYGLGLWIASTKDDARTSAVFALGVGGNLGLIVYFKYAGFLVAVTDRALNLGWTIPDIVLPLAISFFTFQQIAYLADVKVSKKAELSLLNYALFVTFFPQLIAGPIVHHKEMLPQYARHPAARPAMRNIAIGLTIFSIGLFKKMLFADTVGGYATEIFDGVHLGRDVTFYEAWAGALAYTQQIYFDFSGYSDMAIGIGLLFGFKLPLNFLSPYKATSIIDFWRTWHMTLSRFLRDYLYVPLGGNKKGATRRYINVMITMVLGGLWHGAGWTFIVWGALHGAYLMINHFWRWLLSAFASGREKGGRVTIWLSRGLTFGAVVVGWVFFRAESLESALHMLSAMSGLHGVTLPLLSRPYFGGLANTIEAMGISFTGMFVNNLIGDPQFLIVMLLLFMVVIWAAPNTASLLRAIDERQTWLPMRVHSAMAGKLQWRVCSAWGVVTGILLALCLASLSQVSEFIYFNF